MSYIIKISLKNGTERMLIHSGNKFFWENDRFTYEMTYKEAIKFDTLVAGMLEDRESKSGRSSVAGTIVSVKSESSGRNIACTIKDKDNIVHDINLGSAKIIDSTGNGSMILHEKDEIKVFYEKDNQNNKGIINGLTVFIKTSGK